MPLIARPVSLAQARRIWIAGQRLNEREPFGTGPDATRRAIEHLGYVQIDTINVIERSHHHILYSRIPNYSRADLHRSQTIDKTVFEYWTHALAYVPVRDLRFFMGDMKEFRRNPIKWFGDVADADVNRMIRVIRDGGAISIRDIDDEPVEKIHPWASRKPSKAALQRAFFDGRLAISERVGMVKSYELLDRHFAWEERPRAATDRQVIEYMLDRALRSQGIVSIESIYHTHARFRPALQKLIDRRVRNKTLVPVELEAAGKTAHWAAPETLDAGPEPSSLTHILSPFDPLIIQRKRLRHFFDYDHLFEAYVPKARRKFGYFTLPVLVGDEIVAALDLKTDRAAGRLMIQSWHWLERARPRIHKPVIEEELQRFECFQLGRSEK